MASAEALATLPLASMPAFYPEHAYDIAGLLKALRELPSGEELRELRDHIKRLNKAHSLAVARRDDPRWDLVSFAGQRDLGPALLGRGRLTEIRRFRAGSSFPFLPRRSAHIPSRTLMHGSPWLRASEETRVRRRQNVEVGLGDSSVRIGVLSGEFVLKELLRKLAALTGKHMRRCLLLALQAP